MDLESILSSSCRRKILKILASNGPTNIMALIQKVNGKYPQVNTELHILKNEEIILDQTVGRMRIIRLNKENAKTGLLLQALKLLHSTEESKPTHSDSK
jgi:predicted transcriptional regulator